jgi:hypothetical protein
MLELLLICSYCGNSWNKLAYSLASIENDSCMVCGDKNLIVKDNSKSKIDYYQGSPAFEKKKDPDWTWGGG